MWASRYCWVLCMCRLGALFPDPWLPIYYLFIYLFLILPSILFNSSFILIFHSLFLLILWNIIAFNQVIRCRLGILFLDLWLPMCRSGALFPDPWLPIYYLFIYLFLILPSILLDSSFIFIFYSLFLLILWNIIAFNQVIRCRLGVLFQDPWLPIYYLFIHLFIYLFIL